MEQCLKNDELILTPPRVLYGKTGGKSFYERTKSRSRWGRVMTFGEKRA